MSSPDVLLVSCYELGHSPSGIAWPAAFLRRAGVPFSVLDLAVDPFDDDLARAARVVAISVPMHTALRLGLDAAARVRALNPGAHLCFHGLYAGLHAEMLLSGTADSVASGECETVLVDLARAVLAGADVSAVDGLSTPGKRSPASRARLDFPVPDRSGLPGPERYARYAAGGCETLAGHVEASRGCLHLCRHCPVVPIYGGRFFAVPVETVLADVRAQVAAGARHLTFGDPDFLNGPTHALRVARALHAEHPQVSFDFTAKIEHIVRHRALFPELRALGCTFVVSAVESLSDHVLERLAKGHTARDVEVALGVLDAAGIALQPTLVAFTPWTTLDDYLATLDFFRTRGLVRHVPPVQLSIRLLLPPGSPLLDLPDAHEWREGFDASALAWAWRHPDPHMDALSHAVSARVGEGEAAGEDPAVTWEAVRGLALAAAGRCDDALPPEVRLDPPRLTEDWFC